MSASPGTGAGDGPGAIRVPAGGSARLWLRERVALARNASDLLEQKRRALRNETDRLGRVAEMTAARWRDACREAERWTLRAELMGGEEQILIVGASIAGTAQANLTWHSVMGLAYPFEASCQWPSGSAAIGLGTSAALAEAVTAARGALAAAVEAAAAQCALQLTVAELEVTARRRRALERRWIPRLEAALAQVEFVLDEHEREEIARLRWVGLRTGGGGDGNA